MNQDLTTSPKVLTNITEDVRYSIQNQSPQTLRIKHAASAPDSSDGSFFIEPEGWAQIRKTSGNEIYVWVNNANIPLGSVEYDEAA